MCQSYLDGMLKCKLLNLIPSLFLHRFRVSPRNLRSAKCLDDVDVTGPRGL